MILICISLFELTIWIGWCLLQLIASKQTWLVCTFVCICTNIGTTSLLAVNIWCIPPYYMCLSVHIKHWKCEHKSFYLFLHIVRSSLISLDPWKNYNNKMRTRVDISQLKLHTRTLVTWFIDIHVQWIDNPQ